MALDRKVAVPRLLAKHDDLLIVTGLAGASKDMAALTEDADYLFTLAGAMGAATSIGLGLALMQSARTVVVVTGDGELMMSVGSLATVAGAGPANLAIICVNNGHHGETGYQQTHTSGGTDLEAVARGFGIAQTVTVRDEASLPIANELIRRHGAPRFINLEVDTAAPPQFKRDFDARRKRQAFRRHIENLTS
jgi:thiamine pyrophosphate-dependent acetolactate synthase large subunit-like protein